MAGHHGGGKYRGRDGHWRKHAWVNEGDPSDDRVARRVVLSAVGLIAGTTALVAIGCAGWWNEAHKHPDAPWLPKGTPTPKPSETRGQIDLQGHHIHNTLPTAQDPGLRRLAAVEKQFDYGVAANIIAEQIPRSLAEARAQAAAMVKRLKEYGRQQPAGIQPIVYFAPHPDTNLNTLNNGANTDYYNGMLEEYFGSIARSGEITAKEMGVWVPFPNPNSPEGKKNGVTDPAMFLQNGVPVMQKIKEHFNDAQVGVMLDATSPFNDLYLRDLPHQEYTAPLVDVVGIHGYPDSPTASAASYLPANLAIHAAQMTGAKKVMFDTGTASSYAHHNGTLHVTTEQRGQQLQGSFHQMQSVQQAGLSVFAANIGMEGPWAYALGTPDSDLMLTAIQDAATIGYPITFGV